MDYLTSAECTKKWNVSQQRMVKILFVCHGNICRSPMGEYIMKALSKNVECASAATSTEEIGNDIYPPAKRKLKEKGIPFSTHHARQIRKQDYSYYDYILCMDDYNLRNLKSYYNNDPEHKIYKLLSDRSVSDPWYTGDFEQAYNDIYQGCKEWLERFSV